MKLKRTRSRSSSSSTAGYYYYGKKSKKKKEEDLTLTSMLTGFGVGALAGLGHQLLQNRKNRFATPVLWYPGQGGHMMGMLVSLNGVEFVALIDSAFGSAVQIRPEIARAANALNNTTHLLQVPGTDVEVLTKVHVGDASIGSPTDIRLQIFMAVFLLTFPMEFDSVSNDTRLYWKEGNNNLRFGTMHHPSKEYSVNM